MGNFLHGMWALGNKVGFEYLFFCILDAAIIGLVAAIGAFGVALLTNKNETEFFQCTFMVVGVLTFFILILSSC